MEDEREGKRSRRREITAVKSSHVGMRLNRGARARAELIPETTSDLLPIGDRNQGRDACLCKVLNSFDHHQAL